MSFRTEHKVTKHWATVILLFGLKKPIFADNKLHSKVKVSIRVFDECAEGPVKKKEIIYEKKKIKEEIIFLCLSVKSAMEVFYFYCLFLYK